jgi:leader peptidase (prepilin peptidase)/N-methyltransferase
MLGRQALGFGDVTLMAMIGSFLGWQPTLIAIAVGAVSGVAIALATGLLTGRSFVAFGPYLALGAVLTLAGWRFLWVRPIRDLMGDAVGLGMLVALTVGATAVALLLARGYRSLPVRPRDGS